MPSRTAVSSPVSVLLTLGLLATSVTAQTESQSLRLKWIPGHVYTQETTTETTTVLTAIGQPQDQKMKVRQTTRIEVTGTADGGKEARVTFAAIAGELNDGHQTYYFDSSNMGAAPPLIRKSLGQSVGTTFVLKYNAEDEFVGVKDAGAMAKSDSGYTSLLALADSQAVADLYRRSLEMGLPKMRVKPDDRWTSEEVVEFPSAGPVKSELRGRFDSMVQYRERPHAKISFEADLSGSGKESASGVSLGKGSKSFGQVLFDVQASTVSFAAFRADVYLNVEGKQIPVKQQVTTKLMSVEPAL